MKQNLSIRTLLMGVVVVIVLAVVFLRGDQLVELAEVISHGSLLPIVVALAIQLGKYFLQAVAYTFAFEAVGERYSARHTLPLVFGTFFMNTVAPSANLAGITLVVDDARRRGIDPGKAGSAALLMQITIDTGFAAIILVGFSVVGLTVGIPAGWFGLVLIDLMVVLAMVGVLFLGRINIALLIRILGAADRIANRVRRVFRKGPLDPWVERTAHSFAEASSLIMANPVPTLKSLGCSVGASVCELACFVLVGISFGVDNVQALVCGYVVATLFAMFSLTPQGVGFVETAVTVAFTTFGQSAAAGLSIGLVYRSIVFWMPFLIGAVLIQMTSTFKRPAQLEAARIDVGRGPDDSSDADAGVLPDVRFLDEDDARERVGRRFGDEGGSARSAGGRRGDSSTRR
ncbi:lysylphosphatidylglycerol synthase transmembrane domain-containing protein [Berryella wangjianweii]|uniref:lysylphosphatidylglycerol synthase transmembrane domain-containing protein n=1 Tax=Berryella wangjianweii TaxID=2734634 RepID=UPI0021BD8AC6|nr:lysylphosphatidylglycerol synthase transmembrane domain-containing protein [Berryella wangjianweii]